MAMVMEQKTKDMFVRKPNGFFAKGNKGGPGNALGKKVNDYRKAILDAVDAKDVVKVFRALMVKAQQGDVAAASLVLDRLMGKATQTLNVQGGASQTINVLALLSDPAMLARANELAQAVALQDSQDNADTTVPLCSDTVDEIVISVDYARDCDDGAAKD